MAKRCILFVCTMLVAALLCLGAMAAPATPVTATIELTPSFLASPGEVTVTITVSNTTDEDLTKPVTLYDNTLAQVADFGTNGEVYLKAGETYTWTGVCQVDENTLNHGLITYSCKYFKMNKDGEAVEQTVPVQGKLLKESVTTLLQVKRTITPQVAKPDQKGTVSYLVTNAGTVTITDISFKENDDIHPKTETVAKLEPGKSFKIDIPFTMGKKPLTSGATITYYSEESTEKQAYVVEDQQILCGNSSITATLTSNSKGAVVNSVITLTLTLKNEGTIDFSDIRVTDPTLGDVFTNQQLPAGEELVLTKEITLTETTTYQFTITAADASGSESVTGTEAVVITAVNAEDVLNLTVVSSADKTEAYGNPADVRFTVEIINDSNVAASNVKVFHGETELAQFSSIPAGEKRTINRDTALSHSGKYQFTVTAQDPLENDVTFTGNEMQIAVLPPTPPPATPTPVVETPTPAPFVPATYIPGSDPSIGAVPKAIRSWAFPLMIITAVLFAACAGLLIVASKRRADKKKASDAALDHLERTRRRDYITPSLDEREKEEKAKAEASRKNKRRKELTPEQKEAQMANRRIVGEPRDEEPGWNFGSEEDAAAADSEMPAEESAYSLMRRGLYDEDYSSDYGEGFDDVAPAEDGFADVYTDDYAGASQEQEEDDGYTAQYMSGSYGEAADSSYPSDDRQTYEDAAPVYGDASDDGYYSDYTASEQRPYEQGYESYADPYAEQQPYEESYEQPYEQGYEGYTDSYYGSQDGADYYDQPEEYPSYEADEPSDADGNGRRRSRFRSGE